MISLDEMLDMQRIRDGLDRKLLQDTEGEEDDETDEGDEDEDL